MISFHFNKGIQIIKGVVMANKIPGNLLTTAMAVMSYTDVALALDMALSFKRLKEKCFASGARPKREARKAITL